MSRRVYGGCMRRRRLAPLAPSRRRAEADTLPLDRAHVVQCEKAFQKQLGVSGCFKSKDKKAPGHSGHRFHKNVGLGFKTPREAIHGASNKIKACARALG